MLAERIAAKNVLAVRVDVDEDPELAAALKVRSAPTILAFKDGEEKDRLQGFRDASQLLMWLMVLGGAQTAPGIRHPPVSAIFSLTFGCAVLRRINRVMNRTERPL